MHLRHLQDDFLRRASKIRGYFDNHGAGTNGCAISEVLRRFFKSERNPCGGEYACAWNAEKKSMRNFEKALDKTEEM